MRLLVSELAGRATIELKGRALGLEPDRAAVGRVIERVKELESVGYSFEAAEASFELLLREEMGQRPRYFELESWRVIVERRADGEVVSEATVKVQAKGERIVATGEGNGPVNALDNALRLALGKLYPSLASLELVDYKVRIVSGAHGTDAVTRVLVETSDGTTEWDTVGVHENVIAASWQALEDAYTTGLLRTRDTAVAWPSRSSRRRRRLSRVRIARFSYSGDVAFGVVEGPGRGPGRSGRRRRVRAPVRAVRSPVRRCRCRR